MMSKPQLDVPTTSRDVYVDDLVRQATTWTKGNAHEDLAKLIYDEIDKLITSKDFPFVGTLALRNAGDAIATMLLDRTRVDEI